jgi:stage V sporulation protein G
MVRDIRGIKGPTGLFVSMPAKKQTDGTYRELAYPADAETRMMIQRVILAEYKKIVGERDSVQGLAQLPNVSDRLNSSKPMA